MVNALGGTKCNDSRTQDKVVICISVASLFLFHFFAVPACFSSLLLMVLVPEYLAPHILRCRLRAKFFSFLPRHSNKAGLMCGKVIQDVIFVAGQ